MVLYEEALDGTVMRRALDYIRKADMLIIGGTSLVVYPAAGLVNDYRGNKLTLINKGVTSMDWQADLVVSGPIGRSWAPSRFEETAPGRSAPGLSVGHNLLKNNKK